jgi:EAL domain-containing protein (putative c-di-GMP-specific phosphodiesterase class I)
VRNFVDWLKAPDLRFRRFSLEDAARVPDVLAVGELRVVYQPIIDMRSVGALARGSRGARIFAYEALVRSNSPHFKGPPAMFDEAIRTQFVGALGRVVRELTVSNSPAHPLFVNVHPNEFDDGWLVQPDDPVFGHDQGVYLEITEAVPLSHFALCHSVLAELRNRGVFLAVDDLGAGYSNLKYIADLSPEMVKLDRELIVNLRPGTRQHRLVRSIVRLCEDLGTKVVAEGIETKEEALAVVDTGAHYGQGYFFARPSFPPPLPTPVWT